MTLSMKEIRDEVLEEGGKTPLLRIKELSERFPDHIALRNKELGIWNEISYLEFWNRCKYIASAFCLPSFFIGRNELENILINQFEKDNLSINLKNEINNFNSKNLEEKLFECHKNMGGLIDDNNPIRINQTIKNL